MPLLFLADDERRKPLRIFVRTRPITSRRKKNEWIERGRKTEVRKEKGKKEKKRRKKKRNEKERNKKRREEKMTRTPDTL